MDETVDHADPFEDDALWDAIHAEDASGLDRFLATVPDPAGLLGEVLRYAGGNGDLFVARWALARGGDVNARNAAGETPFSFACCYDHLEVARLLHAHGADVNHVDEGGGSPLDWAVCHASATFREWLVSIGARRHDASYEPWPVREDA